MAQVIPAVQPGLEDGGVRRKTYSQAEKKKSQPTRVKNHDWGKDLKKIQSAGSKRKTLLFGFVCKEYFV